MNLGPVNEIVMDCAESARNHGKFQQQIYESRGRHPHIGAEPKNGYALE